jgi:drug/metabolite transporter (DMT)-like permease
METDTVAGQPARPAAPAGARPGDARRGLWLALAAVGFISIASVCVRWAAPVPSVEIAFWRLAIAALAVLAAAGARRQWPRYRQADLPILAGIGLVTAVHFLAYIAAVAFTTIAHTLALIYTAPLFVAALAASRLRERPRPVQLVGMVVTVAGVAVLTGFEPAMSPQMALGDGLALVSAATLAIYSVAGRALRGRYPLLSYTAAIYGSGALWLLPAAAATFDPSHYTLTNSLAVLALGLVPLGLGHTLYNAALRRVPAVTVNTIATQEVTFGVLLAWLLLAEAPGPVALLGVALTLAGVITVLRAER